VLALNDQALARLCIGASRVPVAERARWLQQIAAEVDPGPPPKPVPARTRLRAAGRRRWHRWAALRRAGRATVRVEYDGAILARLIVAGWLPRSDADCYSPEAIGRAVSDLIACGDLPRKI
jgi:hypothetical protein